MKTYNVPDLIEVEATLLAIEETEKQLNRLQERLEALPIKIQDRLKDDKDLRLEIAHYLYWYVERLPVDKIAVLLDKTTRDVCNQVGPATFEVTCEQCGQVFEREFKSRTNLKNVLATGRFKLDENKALCESCYETLTAKQKARDRDWEQQYQARESARKVRLQELRNMPYSEYLQTPEWDETRKRALKRSGYHCQICNQGDCLLHVHHRTYERLGEEWNRDLIVLCESCHELFHTNGRVVQ